MRSHFVGQAAQIERLGRQLGLPGLGARQRQQSIDETRQPIGLLEHAADDAAIRRLVAALAQADLADAADRRQRRPQLVRNVRRELPHLLERPFQPSERFVEHRRQPPHLVVRDCPPASRSLNRSAVIERARSLMRSTGRSARRASV